MLASSPIERGCVVLDRRRGHRGDVSATEITDYVIDQHGCWVWQRAVNHAGYALECRGGPRAAARLYFEREHGPLAPCTRLEHRCGNRRCVNPAHQVACSRSDLSRRYAARWLNPTLACELRRRHAAGEATSRLAADLGVNYFTVADAIAGRTWAGPTTRTREQIR
jgi:hypothetical protein